MKFVKFALSVALFAVTLPLFGAAPKVAEKKEPAQAKTLTAQEVAQKKLEMRKKVVEIISKDVPVQTDAK